MNALKVLASPRVWGPIPGLAAVPFHDGSLDAAGLEDAVRMICLYLVGPVVLGYSISLLRDPSARRKGTRRFDEGVETAG